MDFLPNLYKKLFSPIYKNIQAEIANERNCRELELQAIRNEMNNIQGEVNRIQGETGGIRNSIQYFADTLAEQSYQIQCSSNEIKSQMYELKKIDVRLRAIAQSNFEETNRILQIVPVFRRGDAIGDYAVYIDKVLRANGMDTQIYTYQNLSNDGNIKKIEDLETNASDMIILHMAAENDFAEIMEAYSAKKVLYYHNITPSEFFHDFDSMAEQSTKIGRMQVERLVSVVDCCIADSEYNKEDLKQMGYQCPIYVLQIPFEKNKFETIENLAVKSRIDDGKINLIFVGRIAPNKKIEDVIRCYQMYKDNYNSNARLILVGNYDGEGRYYQYVNELIRDTDDIIMTGHVDTKEWITYYKYADVFVCMSEHEGYCVPLIEAMSFGIPIVAFRSCAVPETLGAGGVLLEEKNMEDFAESIHKIVTSPEIKEEMKKKQLLELQKYDVDKIELELKACITKIMEECHND